MKKLTAAALSLMICITALFCASCAPKTEVQEKKTSELAVIDTASVYKLQAFITANENILKNRRTLEAEYADKMKQASDEQKKDLRILFEKDMLAVYNKEMNPLKDRVSAAISIIAAEKNIKVVLDKTIVVTGAEDITDAVKDKFRQEGDLKADNSNIGDDSTVAYFDQEVIRSLKPFRDADKKMQQEWTKARADLATQSNVLSAEKLRALTADYEKKLSDMNDMLTVPLLKSVTDTVNEVASEKKYVIVVGKQYVMFGGKNITDTVVERFIAKNPDKAEPAQQQTQNKK